MITSKFKILFFATVSLLLFKLHLFAQIKKDTIEIKGKVIFLTIDEVYFDIGAKDGLSVNDTVLIFRNDSKIDSLFITDISEQYSKAKSEFEKVKNIKIGDIAVVRKIKEQVQEQHEVKILSEQNKENNVKLQTEKVEFKALTKKGQTLKSHGRIALQNYSLFSQSYSYQRPALLFVANFDKFFFDNLKINTYAKIENNFSKSPISSNKQTRLLIYQLSIEYQLTNLVLSAGRIFPYQSPGIGGSDGIQLMMRNQTLSFGFVAGTQPQMDNNTFNFSNPKFSFFIAKDFRNSSISGRMSLSYSKILKNRKLEEEFLYVQNFIRVSKLTDIYLSAQVDLNKSTNGQTVKKLNFRNVFTSLSFTPLNWFRFSLDFNTYRSAYLFETMKNLPDSIIDKRFRSDLRGRFYINLPFDITLNLTSSLRSIQGEKRKDSFSSGYVSIDDIFSSGFDITAGLSYANTRFSKILSEEISFEKFFSNRNIGLNCNFTSYAYTASVGEKFTNLILRAGFIFNIGKSYSVLIDYERNWQKSAGTNLIFGEISYRF
ncbi:hypothetical protein [Candidatus Chrysopegis kryptomonas]|uniref:Uncharacterized protein n=1 Tax=Candidatus Chryseopegocella kryptomonas TaxID=1633643 RepID=A0A0N7MWL9_9BACT|nr:hypothetical protein [Candidatus Chrysopegis kryptomonas]CUS99011.1 hypothetical protein JGI23_00583 [Candidatus Chrysopegis kryptomonas]